ncbi:hypothetical protein IV203_016229 [Nitzschia inconspicua]|uniref:Uncharacterized protein n=1 Tax=Nitzschia inconspicua TaxID=303405 RepID=A0A9K3KPI4_9STRA|nr:hypothetical protein IV203_017444 [Nitzschia inconspicua]KAG7347524.1 hypothetical protein IV203_016229 [Nitzschia inconspicua]
MLLGLIYEDIDRLIFDTHLGFEDDGITPKYASATLPLGHKSLLVHLRIFVIHEYEVNGIDIQVDWTQFDTVKLNRYRISQEAVTRYRQFKGASVVTNTHFSPQPDPTLHYWKQGVKRDQSIFPTLKAEPSHDSWHRTCEDQAHAQGVAHIVDDKYSPSNPDEERESKMQIPKGKEIIRNYEATKNAQTAYADLMEHRRESTATSIELSTPSLQQENVSKRTAR